MSRYSLSELQDRFASRASELEALVIAAEASGEMSRQVATAEHCVVALQDAYARFIRELILRSTLGNASNATGAKIMPGPLGVLRSAAALDELRRNWPAYYVPPRKRRARKPVPPVRKPLAARWEPDWHVDYHWTEALRILRPRNAGSIAAALGAGSSAALELRAVRNFAVHRGKTSARGIEGVATKYRLAQWRQPREIIIAPVGGGPAGLFSNWCVRLRAVSGAAVR